MQRTNWLFVELQCRVFKKYRKKQWIVLFISLFNDDLSTEFNISAEWVDDYE